jgi:hypothetical protein
MTLNVLRWAMTVALVIQGAGVAAKAAAPEHRASDEAREVAFLVHAATADSLATASLLAHLVETGDARQTPDSTLLMQRAVALDPKRPELNWLLLRDCELRHCAEEGALVAKFRAADPDNGLAFAPALNASRAGPPAETTQLIAQMGAAKYLTLYWNKLTVRMFDALTHGPKSPPATALTYAADDRLSHVVGVLTAIDTAPFKPIMAVCAADQLTEAGRRAACESLMARLDASDSLIAQSLSVTVQMKWWPASSAEFKALRVKSQQQHYLVEASNRVRGDQVDADALTRVDAMRRLATEEDVGKAMLTAFHEPLQRPDDWTSATP